MTEQSHSGTEGTASAIRHTTLIVYEEVDGKYANDLTTLASRDSSVTVDRLMLPRFPVADPLAIMLASLVEKARQIIFVVQTDEQQRLWLLKEIIQRDRMVQQGSDHRFFAYFPTSRMRPDWFPKEMTISLDRKSENALLASYKRSRPTWWFFTLSLLFYATALLAPAYNIVGNRETGLLSSDTYAGFSCLALGLMATPFAFLSLLSGRIHGEYTLIPLANVIYAMSVAHFLSRQGLRKAIGWSVGAAAISIGALFVTQLPRNEAGGINQVRVSWGALLWIASTVCLVIARSLDWNDQQHGSPADENLSLSSTMKRELTDIAILFNLVAWLFISNGFHQYLDSAWGSVGGWVVYVLHAAILFLLGIAYLRQFSTKFWGGISLLAAIAALIWWNPLCAAYISDGKWP